jgi:cyclophilin family peptidyl-prolyl cis-trans isomerase/HEAT repeat protein
MSRIALLLIVAFATLTQTALADDGQLKLLAKILKLEDSRASANRLDHFIMPNNATEVRRRALIALGAAGDPAACDGLLLHINDPNPQLAQAAIRALGNLWYPNRLGDKANPPDDRALDELEKFIFKDFDAETAESGEMLRNEAIRSFGMIARGQRAAPLSDFLDRALESKSGGIRIEQIKSALVALFRTKAPKARETATKALAHPDSSVRTYAAIALGRLRKAQAIPALTLALEDQNAHVRAEAARALGRLGTIGKPDPLFPMLYSRMDEEVIGALAGFGKGRHGVNVARCAEMLAELKKSEDVKPVHLAIIDALGRRGDEDAVALLETQLRRKGALRIRTLKALGGARAAHVLMGIDAESFAGDHLAAAAYVDALADCNLPAARQKLRRLFVNPLKPSPYRFDPRGKAALIGAALEAGIEEAIKQLAADLESDDALIREIACDHLSKNPDVLAFHAAKASWNKSMRGGDTSAALSALNALEKIGDQFKDPNPIRREIVDQAGQFLKHKNLLIRSRCAQLLHRYTGTQNLKSFFNMDTGRPDEYYQKIAAHLTETTRYRVSANKGDFVVEIRHSDAPLFAARFRELVEKNFYNGLVVHRVEPNFVMQTGDPQGAGWGGSGLFVRDETGRLPFEAYTAGLATAGRDTGDSQWFITHLPTPHLDGAYTAFGRVIAGHEVVDRIVVGDVIKEVVAMKSETSEKAKAMDNQSTP